MGVEIFNRQRKIAVRPSDFQEFAEHAVEVSPAGGRSLSVEFVSDARIGKLNGRFRGKNSATDVLSFPNEPDDFDPDKEYLGDIVISAERAHRQAEENNLSLNLEIKQLILHGILHLCGYDHETDDGEMNALELELRDKLKINR